MVSACLLGLSTRYDGKSKPCQSVLSLLERHVLVPFCPEQLGGLPTPREKSEIQGGKGYAEGVRVVTESGRDVTENYIRGALETLKLARLFKPDLIILKSKSPACGLGEVYDGTFSGKLVKGDGVTAYHLKREGYKLITEKDLGRYFEL